jgi:NADP-dependent 3-hydroxy acid dehydrogenase YdfG
VSTVEIDRTFFMKTAIVTGASSGIGAATARLLATHGWHVWTGARRLERLQELQREIGGDCAPLDVTDTASVNAFVAGLPDEIHLLVNNAGGALGLESIAEADEEKWTQMWQSNVLGLMRMTRACLPKLIAGRGHIVNVTSIAGREAYPNGAGYTTAKHAARVITQTLRVELNGLPVRVTDIAPGLVETEFSVVRFDGDRERADNVYRGITPLVAEDIAECIVWAAERPAHVNIDEMVVKPLAQASATVVARDKGL